MTNGLAYRTRIILIEIGKQLPFIVCVIVAISYIECLYSLITQDYVLYEDAVVLNKTISWWFGSFFEYNLVTIVILFIISIAVETCKWNKLAILYLLLQLGGKAYFATIEFYEEYICAIVAINILISGFFTYKGVQILTTKHN